MPSGARIRSALFACAVSIATCGCNLHNPGDDPPRDLLYFPNTMAISPRNGDDPPRYLYVGNSDFDLRYRSGTVQAFSLAAIAKQVAKCGRQPACEMDDVSEFVASEVRITPFVTAIGLTSDGRYLFAATRTDKTLLYMRVDSSANGQQVLYCPNDENNRCKWRANTAENALADDGTDLAWPDNAEALLSGPLSDWIDPARGATDAQYVMVAHQQGVVSLFALQGDERDDGKTDRLVFASELTGLGAGLTQVTYDPTTKLIYIPLSANSPFKVIQRVGIDVPDDAKGEPDVANVRPYAAGYVQLDGVAGFSDTRDIAFIKSAPGAGGVASNDRALIVSDEPSALLVADLAAKNNLPNHARVLSQAIVGRGAQRVVYGDFDGHPTAVVGSFSSRELAAIDLTSMQVRAIVPNLSGPFALALDEPRKLLYAADFRSSVIRVVDLAPLFDPNATEADVRVVLTLGKPRVLQELR